MRGISCLVNFKSNLSKNIPYYDLLIRRIGGEDGESLAQSPWICEQAALFGEEDGSIVSKICEGYQFTIAFSGNISGGARLKRELSGFGYHFLTEKDAELALSCYIHFGENCAKKLCGDFSFIIYDGMRRQVFALSGSSGSMPIFYAKTDDGYILSSSLKGIFAHPGISKKISSDGVLELLSCQNRISTRIFEDVCILPSCSFLKISKASKKTENYLGTATNSLEYDMLKTENAGLILSGTELDVELLKELLKTQEKRHMRTSVYAEKFCDDLGQYSTRNQHLLVDDGTVLWALETVVSSCGFALLSDYDYLLPIALKRAKGNGETLFFTFPDRFYPNKNYILTLIKNGAFYRAIEDNIRDYVPKSDVLPSYPSLICDTFDTRIKTPFIKCGIYNDEEILSHCASGRIKTALRHILLDIISREHSPIIAFFKRSALLRLCEGGFSFAKNESESELIAYLIKLNMWFEIYRPRII